MISNPVKLINPAKDYTTEKSIGEKSCNVKGYGAGESVQSIDTQKGMIGW